MLRPITPPSIRPDQMYAVGHNHGLYTGSCAGAYFDNGVPTQAVGQPCPDGLVSGAHLRQRGMANIVQAWEAVKGHVIWWDAADGWTYGPKKHKARAVKRQRKAAELRASLQAIADATGAPLREVEEVAAKLQLKGPVNVDQFKAALTATHKAAQPAPVAITAAVALLKARTAAGVDGY